MTFLEFEGSYVRCIVGFHYTNSNNAEIKAKALRHVGHGIWLEEQYREEALVITWLDPRHSLCDEWTASLSNRTLQEIFPAGSLAQNAAMQGRTLKAVMAWFHPGKEKAYVLLYSNSQVQFIQKSSLHAAVIPWEAHPPNGTWSWAKAPEELLTTWFHHQGRVDDANNPASLPTIFKSIGVFATTGKSLYRAIGTIDAQKYNVRIPNCAEQLRHWHVFGHFLWQDSD